MGAYVIFFGGFKASIPNVKAWKASAEKQRTGVLFDSYPYPDASADGDDAVKVFKKATTHGFTEAIKKIQDSKSDKIFIVGHSSGCAVANAVDAQVKDHKNIVLVALDGYLPSREQLDRPSTQVWVAESGIGKSLHHDGLIDNIKEYNRKAKVPQTVHIHTASPDCTMTWALHFSLVNLLSSNILVGNTSAKAVAHGYDNCNANLAWLP